MLMLSRIMGASWLPECPAPTRKLTLGRRAFGLLWDGAGRGGLIVAFDVVDAYARQVGKHVDRVSHVIQFALQLAAFGVVPDDRHFQQPPALLAGAVEHLRVGAEGPEA